MKKVSLVVLLSATLMAQSGWYVGADVGMGKNTTTFDSTVAGDDSDESNNYNTFSAKVGYGFESMLDVELYVANNSYKEPVIDETHKSMSEVGINVRQSFEVGSAVIPFVKLGLSKGSMDLDPNFLPGYTLSDSSIDAVSVALGVGASYKLDDHLYAVGGIDYVSRTWADLAIQGYGTVSTTDKAIKPYIGIDYRF